MATEVADDMAGSGQPKAAVLLIVGEPFSDSSKQQILDEITNGLKRWDSGATGVDIDPELSQMALRADLGDERRHGERVITHRSGTMMMDLLINAQAQTVKDSLRTLLTSPSTAKAVIYAGYTFHGSAAWVMQDDLFSSSMLSQMFKDSNVENALKRTEGASLMLSTLGGSNWTSALKGSEMHKLLKVTVNPAPKMDSCQGLAQFSAYVNNLVRVTPLTSMLQASDVIGNISFSRPVLYIFPSYQGDAALFGMKGFNMLVDGGYSRRPCFWDFVRHLDGIDALLMTHLGPDNLFGLKALLERKMVDSVHPDVDYMYMNVSKTNSNGVKAVTQGQSEHSELVINLAAEGSMLVDMSRKLGHTPHPLTRPLSSNLEPVNLFHKIGKGSLDMYILNPVGDAKEMKEFLAQWGQQAASFSQANGIPIPNCSSICALLVVRPASSMEKVTRILFPGTAPQHKLLEGLERVKHLECLKRPTFCTHDLHKAKKAAAGMTNGRASSSTRRIVSATTSRTAVATRAEPPKHLDTKGPSSRTTLTSPASGKTSKLKKDTSNKRVSSVTKDKEKVKHDEKEKENKSKSPITPNSSKASIKTMSPVKSPSSAKTPTSKSPEEQPKKTPKPAGDEKPSEVSQGKDLDQHTTSAISADTMSVPPTKVETLPTVDNRLAASPEALPEPDHFGSDVDTGRQQAPSMLINERQKLQELGIYENDDDDEGVDNRFDEKENGGMFGASEEEVQPQALPEPVAVLETPTSSESDMLPDTFTKPSLMEQSQLFEHGIEPDYGTEGEVSITNTRLEDMMEKQTAGPISAMEPQDMGTSLVTEPTAEPATFTDHNQILGSSSVSDYPAEVSPLAEQQAVESSPMAEPLVEQSTEPSLMTQHVSEESCPAAEPDAEKPTYDDIPQSEPASLIPESMPIEASLPEEAQMGEFAPQPSFPTESDLTGQEPEEVPSETFTGAPSSFAPQDDDQVPMGSDYPEEPKADAYPTDFQEKDEPALSDDEGVKDRTYPADEKEDVGAGFSEEEESAPVAASFVGLQEASPMTVELQMPSSEPAPECPPQSIGYDQTEIQGDSNTFVREASPAQQESDIDEDNVKESHSALEEPSFEDSLKEASPVMDSSSLQDSLRETSPSLQQPAGDLNAALEPTFDDSLRETSPSIEEPGFDMKEKEASPALEETGFDVKEREASPMLEKPEFDLEAGQVSPALKEQGLDSVEREASPAAEYTGFDMKEREPSPAVEDASFDEQERGLSPGPEEQGFEAEERARSPALEEQRSAMPGRDASPGLEEPDDEMKERDTSPALEEEGFDMKAREGSPQVEEPGLEMKEREVSPAAEKTHVDNITETGFDPLKQRETSPALEEPDDEMEKETSPALEEPGYHLEKETSPALEEPGYKMEKETSPSLEEPGYEMEKETSPSLEEPGFEMEKETSPALEEPGYEMKKEASPPLEELGYEMKKETSPPLEEPGYEMKKETSPPLEEPDYEMKKETSPALEAPGYEMEREASPSLEAPGYGMVREASPSLEAPGYEMKKETSPPLEEPDYEMKKETSPVLEEAGYEMERETSPSLEEAGYGMEREASPSLEAPGYEMKKETSPSQEEPGYGMERETSPSLEEPGYEMKKETSPPLEEPDYEMQKETSPALKEPSFDAEKEERSHPFDGDKDDDDDELSRSPPPTKLEAGDHVLEKEEKDFVGKAEASELGALGAVQQGDQVMELKDADKEEEDVLEEEEVMKREGVMEMKRDFGVEEDKEEDDELDADDRAQADMMTRQTMRDMDVSDDEGQDDDEETAEAVDSGDNDNDDFVYEKEVNLADEEVLMAGASKSAAGKEGMDEEDFTYQKTAGMDLESRHDQQKTAGMDLESRHDQQITNIPERESQNPSRDLPLKEEYEQVSDKETPGEGERRLDESYGMEGGLLEEDRDMQAILAMQQGQHQAYLAQEEDSDLDSQEADLREEHSMNPFAGSGEQASLTGNTYPQSGQPYSYEDEELDERDQRAAPKEFDPMAQWGPPTGLPAPCARLDEVDAVPEPVSDTDDDLKPAEFSSSQAAYGKDEAVTGEEHYHADLGAVGTQEHLTDDHYASYIEKGDHKEMPAMDKSTEVDGAEFDPLAEWGQPMGLPAPTPPEASKKNGTAKKGAGDTKKTDMKKTTNTPAKEKTGSAKRPASATKPSPKAMNGAAETPRSTHSKPEVKKQETPRSTRPTSGRTLDTSRNDSKTRTTPTTTRRPASSARSRVSPEVIKMPPLPPFTPFYVDLTYIPNHGDLAYVDSEFFKRVRARYYVLSARNPNPKVLEMLMDAKESWDKANEHEVTVIPTYETQILQHWMAVHQEKLAENKIDIAPAASRCTVRLQDHEDSCYTYRLEF